MKIDIDSIIPNTLKPAKICVGLIVNNRLDNKNVTKEIFFIRYIVLIRHCKDTFYQPYMQIKLSRLDC